MFWSILTKSWDSVRPPSPPLTLVGTKSELSLFLRLPFGLINEYVKILRKTSENGFMSNKCNQYDYSSSEASDYRRHPKMNSGVKLEKCNQCNYAFSQAVHLRRHLKTHSGEKSSKCNQCDYSSSQAGNLRTHLKTHSGEK